jgi:DNA-binding response OmpR family regulator
MEQAPIKVLIVEDDPVDSRVAGNCLRSYPHAGFDVTVADRLNKAFSYLDKNPYDVILLDLNLPDSHGLETLGRARLHSYHCPIVILSGNQSKRLMEGAAGMGAWSYVVKDGGQYGWLAQQIHAMVKRLRSAEPLPDSETEQ